MFDMKEAEESPGWLISLKSANVHSEADEYGVSSFVYRADKPFHPTRLLEKLDTVLYFGTSWSKGQVEVDEARSKTMEANFGNILRSKGYCWIAGLDGVMGEWHQSGRIITINPVRPWYAVIPEEHWGVKEEETIENIRRKLDSPHGDRRNEIVFIGTNLKVDAIIEAFNTCLLTDAEMKCHDYSKEMMKVQSVSS